MSTAALAAAVPAVTIAAPSIAAAVTDADPILAVIERHRAAYTAWERSLDVIEDGDEALWEQRMQAEEDMAMIAPATPAGAAALVCYVASEHARGNTWMDDSVGQPANEFGCSPTCKDFLLRNVAAALAPLAAKAGFSSPPQASSSVRLPRAAKAPDPIFAAIENHRKAWANAHAASDAGRSEQVLKRLYDRECALLRKIARTEPTSLAGSAALVAYINEHNEVADDAFNTTYVKNGGGPVLIEPIMRNLQTALVRLS